MPRTQQPTHQLTHLAIIMDGNGRWAKRRGMPRIMGHRAGAKAVREAITGCMETSIEYLTLYAFSTENWSRPADEISELMNLLRRYIRSEMAEFHENGIKLQFLGDTTALAPDIQEMLQGAADLTKDNTKLTLQVALNYGSQQEISMAAQQLAQQVLNGKITPQDITVETLNTQLDNGIPHPDVILRTSGEQRLSNFLLWQAAYAEFFFIEKHWPEFKAKDVHQLVADYAKRERRYGGLGRTKTETGK